MMHNAESLLIMINITTKQNKMAKQKNRKNKQLTDNTSTQFCPQALPRVASCEKYCFESIGKTFVMFVMFGAAHLLRRIAVDDFA